MARVKCDGCGDEHECKDVAAPAAAGGKNGKPKRQLHPAMVARNEKAKADKAAREATASRGGSTTAAAPAGKGKSIVRELLGF